MIHRAAIPIVPACLALVGGLFLAGDAGLRAQTSYALDVGGYMQASAATAASSYNGGYTFYSAAWPLVGDYTRTNNFQSGLYGTWMSPINGPSDLYTDIEGGLGWWYGNCFKTATPKFIMGGVAWGNNSWWFANSPGSGSTNGNGAYGVAQLSPSLLFPPSGLTLKQGTCGELFGYGYLALPLTKPKTTTAGTAIPTGNHNWTLFLNTTNFKGPLAFFTPYFWSQVAVAQTQWSGALLDSCWANPNRSLAMETPSSIRTVGTNTSNATYARSMPVYYPVDGNGYSLLMHRLSVYSQDTLWNPVDTWLNNNGSAPNGIFDPASTYVQTSNASNPVWTVYNQGTAIGNLNWSTLVTPTSRGPYDVGYQWQTDQMTVTSYGTGSLAHVPDYYQGPASPGSSSVWYPVNAADVPEPAAAALANADFSNPLANSSIVLKTSDPAWTTPGPAAGPCYALLGDGSVVTYYWYRFADQPALQKADMSAAEREEIQLVAEKIHQEWKQDRDYLAPPTSGTLAELDSGQLVTPPLGMDTGYVPIAWQQDWGGSVANPGALTFTTVPVNPVAGQAFSVKVQAQTTSGVAQNVTSDTRVQLSVASGNGVLGGTISGTIPNGSNSVTISGVIYPAAETMILMASATCLSPATSPALTFSTPSGQMNLYNQPATGIAGNQAVLNATVGCPATNATVYAHWGTVNGGNNVTLWTNSASPGTWNNVISNNVSQTVTGLSPNTAYYYIFRATNASGTIWASQVSSFKTLPLAPVIATQPTGATKVAGSPVSLTVTASDAVQYQWYKAGVQLTDGGNLSGANTAILSLGGITTADAGSYSVVVSNGGGSTTSNAAVLSVVAAATLTWDANTSTANPQDGAGNWIGNNWYNGTSNMSWLDYDNAVIGSGGAGGVINPGGASVNNLTFNNFTGTYTIDSDVLTVAGNLAFNSSGTAQLGALIGGTGSLTKSGTGTLQVYGVTQNTFSGGTIVNNGTLYLGAIINGISPNVINPLGTGPVTLNAGTIRFDRVTAANALTVNGGTLYCNNGWGATWSGPVTLNATTTVNATYNMTFNGIVSGTGGFTKTGANTLFLSGTGNFTGSNKITAGTLACTRSGALGSGPLDISAGAIVNLNFTGTRAIAALTFAGGTPQAPGTYGSSASPATNTNDTYFAGTGTVTILPATTTTLALTGGSTPADPGTPLTFTATVSGSSPTGNVAFYDGTTLLGSTALNGSYQAAFTTGSLVIGSHGITAQYAGDAANATSASAAVAVAITSKLPTAPTNLLATPANSRVSLAWTAATGATSYQVKRSLANGGPYTVIGTPAGVSYTDLTSINGTTYYYVVSAINTAGESANSSQVSAIPLMQPSATTLVSAPVGSGIYGDTVTFTATVSVSGAPATGTVTFKDGATVLGTGSLSAGTATFATSALAAANHSLTATYGGDSTYAAGISAPCALAVTARPLSITGITAADKVYDGNASAALTGGALVGAFVGGDVVNVNPGNGVFASPNAGTWAVTATGYSLSGASAGNYLLSAQPAVPNATITARPVQLAGTRVYDGSASAAAAILTVSNRVAGDDLALTGSAFLAGKDVGSQGLLASFPSPVRVQSATGSTGASASTSVSVTLASTPVAGNALVAVISTRGTSASRISGITGGGVTWSRVSQAANSGGATTEIWYGPKVASGTTGITITQSSLRSAAVVIEYSGLLTPASFDLAANSTGSSTSAVTGTTATTSQANELWLGGIGIADGRRTLNAPYGGSFTVIASPASGTSSSDAMIYALEKIVNATGTASSGGTVSTSDGWAGAIATFKSAFPNNLALAGATAGNYSLTGLTGAVTITSKPLAVSGLTASTKIYDGTPTANLSGSAALLPAESAGSGSAIDGKPHTGDIVTLGGTATASFADKYVGAGKPVTVSGFTLAGAQAADYSLTPPAGLTASVSALPVTVAAVFASKTYDGTTTATGTPTITPALAAGDTTTSLAQSFQSAGAGAANKVLVPNITINDGNGGANYAVTLQNFTAGTINPAPATVILGNLTQIFNGAPKMVSVGTNPAGLATTVTYNGTATPPTAIGSYAVTAIITDPNYSGTANGTLVIAAQSIADWRAARFTAAEISAGLAADNADPDGDGLTNLTEYALGTDPHTFSPQPLAITPAAGAHFDLTFTARRATGAGYAGLARSYTVEASATPANPASWLPVTGYTNLVGATRTDNITGDDQTVVVTMPGNIPNHFFRLNVRVE